jgi:hypothetical protein
MGQCLREKRRQLSRFIVRRIARIIRLQGAATWRCQRRKTVFSGIAQICNLRYEECCPAPRCQRVRFAGLTGQSNGGKCGEDPHRALRFENVNGAGFSI